MITSLPLTTSRLPTMPSMIQPSSSHKVAIIGAGAAGLIAARELRREGHTGVVFERGAEIGGTWVYTPEVESDPIGLDPSRKIIHSSIYKSLRTNLPREIMGFRDFPFVASDKPGRDPRRFPAHPEVLRYLEDFAHAFKLIEMIRFQTEVEHVRLLEDGKWNVQSKRHQDDGELLDETYDAVVVCNGHYTEPRIAEIPGIEQWPGKQIHSHNYRVPEPYRDQVVVLIGAAASAVDISRDIAPFAKEVHIAARSEPDGGYGRLPGHDNIWLHPMVHRAHKDGSVLFKDECTIPADIILYCTGYKFTFPFLNTNGIVSVDDNRVGPLYKHVFPPSLAPCLSFIGLTWKIAPFFQFELQSKWIAGVLSGRITLPSEDEMMEDAKALYSRMERDGIPKHYTHNLTGYQFEYNDWIADQCGCPPTEEWRKEMYHAASRYRGANPERYRDEWDDHHLIPRAYEDFAQYEVSHDGFMS